MWLFYFALIISVFLFLNDKKEVGKLFTAIDMYSKHFKVATFILISFSSMAMVPYDFSDLSTLSLHAVLYLYIGLILYGLYKNQPLKVLKIVTLLHIVGLMGRILLEWMEWTPMRLFNILIYVAIIPLYLYIIQLVLTLKRFSSD